MGERLESSKAETATLKQANVHHEDSKRSDELISKFLADELSCSQAALRHHEETLEFVRCSTARELAETASTIEQLQEKLHASEVEAAEFKQVSTWQESKMLAQAAEVDPLKEELKASQAVLQRSGDDPRFSLEQQQQSEEYTEDLRHQLAVGWQKFDG